MGNRLPTTCLPNPAPRPPSSTMFKRFQSDWIEGPHGCRWAGDPKLGRWVSAQRKAKKDLDAGSSKPGITSERIAKLDAIGFDWSPPTGDKLENTCHQLVTAFPWVFHCLSSA